MSGRSLRRVQRALHRAGMRGVACEALGQSIRLSGEVDTWERKVHAGHVAAAKGGCEVVNDISVPGVEEPAMTLPGFSDHSLEGAEYDVVVVGAGVIGAATARELSRHKLRIAVLEKEDDVAVQTTSRNDGMVHPGLEPKPGTLKALYNVRGNRMYTRAAGELGFELKRPGTIMLFDRRWKRLLVPLLARRCRANGVDGEWRYLSAREVRRLEPHVTPRQRGGFLVTCVGIVNPFEVAIAYAENAAQNGAAFHFETAVLGFGVSRDGDGRRIETVRTNRGTLRARAVVNAAGNWADAVAAFAGDRFFTLHGRRGVDLILDKRLAGAQSHVLGMPDFLKSQKSHSKGGGLVVTVEGNLLAGPTAEETPDREDYATGAREFEEVMRHLELNTAAGPADVITYFAGVRPAAYSEDFIIRRSSAVRNLVHAAGIQSPGLASAPAIAADVAALAVEALSERREVEPNPQFDPIRKPRVRPARLPLRERALLIAERPDYGRIVCRCEEVSEGEVRDALRSPLGVSGMDAVKRRTRVGSGRCHGGFCMSRILEIIRDETGQPFAAIRKKGHASYVVTGETKRPAEEAPHA
jgi:glycerol-3-phosphate dehydrogenase